MTLPVGESGAFTELYLIVFESLVSVVLENLDKFFKNLLSLGSDEDLKVIKRENSEQEKQLYQNLTQVLQH